MDGDMVLPQFLNMSIYYFFVIWRNEAILCIVGKKKICIVEKKFYRKFLYLSNFKNKGI